MKALKKLFFMITIMLLSISGCEKNEDNEKNNSLDNYFSIESAEFKQGNQPSGTNEIISNIHINKSVINGGSVLLKLTTTEEISEIFVSITNTPGYYSYKVDNSKLKSQNGELYFYELIILLSQEFDMESFILNISIKTTSGSLSTLVNSEIINVIPVGTGELQVSLSWDQLDDVDLHIIDPDGREIYYANPYAINGDEDLFLFSFYAYLVNKFTNHDVSALKPEREGDLNILEEYMEDLPYTVDLEEELKKFDSNDFIGYLDLDSNAACAIDGINNENIYFKRPKNGTYKIIVNLYSKCTPESVPFPKYSVSAWYQGKLLTIKDEENKIKRNPLEGQFDDKNYNYSNDNYVVIGTFTISNSTRNSVSIKEYNDTTSKLNKITDKINMKLGRSIKSK